MTGGAPDIMEHVVGYRGWRLRWDGRLASAGAGRTIWAPGVNTASCDPRSEHTAPAGDCTCGLYAFHDPPPAPAPGMVGAIRAHGDLESHHDGFRAQHAEVIALVQRGRRARRRERRAADIYGVPLVSLQELEHVAAEHGRPLAQSQRPARERDEDLAEFPRLAAIHDALEHAYLAVARVLRRHRRVRSAALAAISCAPLVALLAWGYTAALASRGEHASTVVGWLSFAPWLVGGAALLARQIFGSRWLRPVRMWTGPGWLLLAVPLQYADVAGVAGIGVETLKWAVGITALAVIAAGLFWFARPIVMAATWAGALVAPVALAHVRGELLLVLSAAALVQYAALFPMQARRLIGIRGAQ